MAYAQLEAVSIRHRKVRILSDGAFRLWIAGLCYAQENLSDGVIHDATRDALGVRVTPALLTELTDGPYGALWERQPNGGDGKYVIHDYDQWNKTRDQILRSRALLAERQERWRAKSTPHESDRAETRYETRYETRDKRVTGRVSNASASQLPSSHLNSEDCASGAITRQGDALRDALRPDPPMSEGDVFRAVSNAVAFLIRQPGHESGADLTEAVKRECARTGVPYDSEVVRKAIDSELVKARRRR